MIPLFAVVSEVMPTLKQLETNARKNVKNWEDFEESAKQRKIYEPRSPEDLAKRWG